MVTDFRVTHSQLNNNQNNQDEVALFNNLKVQLLKKYYDIDELKRLTTLAKVYVVHFRHVPTIYLNNYQLVWNLLNCYDGWCWFKRLPKKLRDYREIVLKACRGNGLVIKHAPLFRNDREIAMTAVKSNPYALRYVSKELRFDISFMLECVHENNYWMIPSEFKKDKEFNLEIIKREFLSEKETILKVLDRYYKAYGAPVLSFIDPILKNDRDIVIKACSRNDMEYEHIENLELKNDPDVLEAIKNTWFRGIQPTRFRYD